MKKSLGQQFTIFGNEATAGFVQRQFAQHSRSVRQFVKA
jgi:hypothetical protein